MAARICCALTTFRHGGSGTAAPALALGCGGGCVGADGCGGGGLGLKVKGGAGGSVGMAGLGKPVSSVMVDASLCGVVAG